MRLNIFRRAENNGKFSYLAVPEGRVIPGEATNTDWEIEAQAVELDDDVDQLPNYAIEHLSEQIADKGYAMTSVLH